MTPADVMEILRKNTDGDGTWFPTKAFHGDIGETAFSLFSWRFGECRGNCAPRFVGEVFPHGTGSRVEVKMALHPFVTAGMIIMFAVLALFVTVSVVSLLYSFTSQALFGGLWCAVSAVILYAVIHGIFRFEIPRGKKALLELLHGEEEICEAGKEASFKATE